MKKDTISIIIPVYKVEQYLRKCLDSVIGQTYRNLEILLVDDGSPDNCGAICEEYAAKDERVRVIHKQNGGVSAARNTGLEAAQGDYIAFVDSDDYIEPTMYEQMIAKAQEYDCDVVLCDCVRENKTGSEIVSHRIRKGLYTYDQLQDAYYPHLLMMESVEFPATISNWLLLFRRAVIERSGTEPLRYVQGIKYSEDLLFGAQLMYRARSFYYLKGSAYYHYCIRDNSASHRYDGAAWEDHKKLHAAAIGFFGSIQAYDFSRQLDLLLLYMVYNTVGETVRETSLSRRERLQITRRILSEPPVRSMFSRLKIGTLPVRRKLKLLTVLYKYRIGLRWIIR